MPEPLFNDGAQQPAGVVLGDAQGMRDGRKKIQAVSLDVFEMTAFHGVLPEGFTADVLLEVMELDIRPGWFMERCWLTSTSLGRFGGEFLVIRDLFFRRESQVKKRL